MSLRKKSYELRMSLHEHTAGVNTDAKNKALATS